MIPADKRFFLFKWLENILSRKTKKADPAPPPPPQLRAPDGSDIVQGVKYRVPNGKHIHGYNINPAALTDISHSGKYLIVSGTELTLLQCEKPETFAPFRWQAFDGVNRMGHIWIDVRELEYVSGNFGIRAT